MDGSALVDGAAELPGVLGVALVDCGCALCDVAPAVRLTTRVPRAALGAFASGQHGIPRVPGVRSDG